MAARKPKIGLLGLMTDGYEVTFPGIIARQEAYAREIVETLSPVADVDFPGAGLNRGRIEEIVKYFNESLWPDASFFCSGSRIVHSDSAAVFLGARIPQSFGDDSASNGGSSSWVFP